jgi:hypothetical protein
MCVCVWGGGVGLPFPLIEKKLMFYSLALSKKLRLIHGDFLTYQDVLHVARNLLGSPRTFLFTFFFLFLNILKVITT